MNSPNSTNNDFLKKLGEVTEANLTNPQFGVSMLAKEMSMSRSNLHRKVNSELKISVSQFINQVRLKKAKDILRHTSDTVSEVAYKVGYNNVSYFIKRFHEFYGYSPGEVGKRKEETEEPSFLKQRIKKIRTILISIISVVLIGFVFVLVFKPFRFQQKKLENTFTILPPDSFDTRDSTYTTDIDGIIQSIINNLSKINEIKIVSPWQSVLQYRNKFKPAPEIAKERKVNYVVKPRIHSIQGIVTLSFNLIDGPGDKHLETFVYVIDSNNITTVHQEFIKEITDKLNILISQAEQGRIDKDITSNRKASKLYWKGVEMINSFYTGKKADLNEAVKCFEKAIDYDNKFAAAYAQIAITYYIMDYHWLDHSTEQHEILYGSEINEYADEAYRIDPHLDLSSIAKALYYKNKKDYENAIDYLHDALEYNPNSYLAISNLYILHTYTKNREEIIKHALMIINSGLPLEYSDNELSLEGIYTWLAQSYRFLGFFKEALYYYDEAIRTNEDYLLSSIYKSQCILHSDEEDKYQKSIKILQDIIKKNSISTGAYSRLGQAYYVVKDYQKAYACYKKGLELSENNVVNYQGLHSSRLAVIFREMGEPEKAQIQINNYREFGESRHFATRSFRLTGYYSFINDTTNTFKELRKASKYYQNYNRISQLRNEPIYDNMRKIPEFMEILSKMQDRWQEQHDSIRDVFKKKGLLDLDL